MQVIHGMASQPHAASQSQVTFQPYSRTVGIPQMGDSEQQAIAKVLINGLGKEDSSPQIETTVSIVSAA